MVDPDPRITSTRDDRIERHRDVHVVMPRLHVVEALPVEQDERLAETRAADREVGLDAVGRTLAQVERGVEAQQVGERVEDEDRVARRQDADGAVDFFERERLVRAGHDDGLALLGKKSYSRKTEDDEAQFAIVPKGLEPSTRMINSGLCRSRATLTMSRHRSWARGSACTPGSSFTWP